MSYNIKARIWIDGESTTIMGNGRVRLLHQIEETGSISKAAKACGMSYKKAWNLVNSMNNTSGSSLVETTSGGENGGGTVVTSEGKQLIQTFLRLQTKIDQILEEESLKLNTP